MDLGLGAQHLPEARRARLHADERRVQVDVHALAPPDTAVRIVVAKDEPELDQSPLGRPRRLQRDQQVDVAVLAHPVVEIRERRALEQETTHTGVVHGPHDSRRGPLERQLTRGGEREAIVGRNVHS